MLDDALLLAFIKSHPLAKKFIEEDANDFVDSMASGNLIAAYRSFTDTVLGAKERPLPPDVDWAFQQVYFAGVLAVISILRKTAEDPDDESAISIFRSLMDQLSAFARHSVLSAGKHEPFKGKNLMEDDHGTAK
jgi:hypothetical protein